MTVYYGQYGQDSVIDSFFQQIGQESGFFVDVGASDGIRFSNSCFLAKERNWQGICVEAHPDYFELLKRNRPESINYGCAVGSSDVGEVDIRLNYRASLTTLDFDLDKKFAKDYEGYYASRDITDVNGFRNGVAQVPVRTIDGILDENRQFFQNGIDVVFIDIDGSEKYALDNFSLKKWSPRILLLEHTVMGHNFVDNFAAESGYIKCKTLGSDNFYVLNKKDLELLDNIVPSNKLRNIQHPALLSK